MIYAKGLTRRRTTAAQFASSSLPGQDRRAVPRNGPILLRNLDAQAIARVDQVAGADDIVLNAFKGIGLDQRPMLLCAAA